ncbi:MAG: hypothetical protein AB8B51_20160 [Sedimentitalea sp.]
MASTPYDQLTDDWSSVSRFTAIAAVDVLLSNPSSGIVYFALTDSNTAPDLEMGRANPLRPKSGRPMQLRAGERLWMAGEDAFAVIEV